MPRRERAGRTSVAWGFLGGGGGLRGTPGAARAGRFGSGQAGDVILAAGKGPPKGFRGGAGAATDRQPRSPSARRLFRRPAGRYDARKRRFHFSRKSPVGASFDALFARLDSLSEQFNELREGVRKAVAVAEL